MTNIIQNQKLSALIITYNEIGYIEKCIDSILFADEILVIDSFSDDGTYEYLVAHPRVKVIQHPFKNFTDQKSYALKQAENDWILFLDADEVVSESLRNEILVTINDKDSAPAYWFYRSFMYKNERLKFSGWQTDKNHRLFKKSKVKFTDTKLVHETLEVEGASGVFKEKLTHYCFKDYEDYKSKMLHYGRLKAYESFYKEKKFSYFLITLKPLWKFINHYFLRLGFLDGKKGLNVCYLNALSVYERYRVLRKLERKNKLAYYLVMP